MCESMADGGRRCSAHTRSGFAAALERLGSVNVGQREAVFSDGFAHVVAHAATGAGAVEVAEVRARSERMGDWETSAWLTTCERVGAAQREAAAEARRRIRDRRGQVPLAGAARRGEVLMLAEGVISYQGSVPNGTYVVVSSNRSRHAPAGSDPADFVDVLLLPATSGDQQPGSWDAGAHVHAVPRSALVRPRVGDPIAAHFADRPFCVDGVWHSQAELAERMRHMSEVECERFEQSLRHCL